MTGALRQLDRRCRIICRSNLESGTHALNNLSDIVIFFRLTVHLLTYLLAVCCGVVSPGGAVSNLYAVAVARYKAEPASKQQGMTSLVRRLVMFTSEHVSCYVTRPTDLDLGPDSDMSRPWPAVSSGHRGDPRP